MEFEEVSKLFPEHHLNKISVYDVTDIIEGLGDATIKDMVYIANKKNKSVSPTTIHKYLYLLEIAGLISKNTEKICSDKNTYLRGIYNFKYTFNGESYAHNNCQ